MPRLESDAHVQRTAGSQSTLSGLWFEHPASLGAPDDQITVRASIWPRILEPLLRDRPPNLPLWLRLLCYDIRFTSSGSPWRSCEIGTCREPFRRDDNDWGSRFKSTIGSWRVRDKPSVNSKRTYGDSSGSRSVSRCVLDDGAEDQGSRLELHIRPVPSIRPE